MKPHIHAESSAKQFGGKPEDYLPIHEFLDSSKGVVSDHRHRALTHNTWFIMFVLPRVFGDTIKNSKGKKVSVRDIGEQHVLEDYRGKFIPSAQDFLQAMHYEDWMRNGDGGLPPSNSRADRTVPAPVVVREIIREVPPTIPVYPPWPPSLPGMPEITDKVNPWPEGRTID